jgi:hypothetical protein
LHCAATAHSALEASKPLMPVVQPSDNSHRLAELRSGSMCSPNLRQPIVRSSSVIDELLDSGSELRHQGLGKLRSEVVTITTHDDVIDDRRAHLSA